MQAARPLVSVHSETGEVVGTVTLPAVFKTSIRPDVVRFVHTSMNKNKRQAYAVSEKAGHQTSAESWYEISAAIGHPTSTWPGA
jgi:large subunit ribosomal protein L4e